MRKKKTTRKAAAPRRVVVKAKSPVAKIRANRLKELTRQLDDLTKIVNELRDVKQSLEARNRFLEKRIIEVRGPRPGGPKALPAFTAPPKRLPDPRRVLAKEKQKILEEDVTTRIRSDFVFLRGTETPCNARGFQSANGIRSLREAILAAAAAFREASVTLSEGGAKGWDGRVDVNGACAPDIAGFLEAFARSPRPRTVQAFVDALTQGLGVRVAGEVTVSYRRVFTVQNRLGNKKRRLFQVSGRPDRRFVIGQRIKDPSEVNPEEPF